MDAQAEMPDAERQQQPRARRGGAFRLAVLAASLLLSVLVIEGVFRYHASTVNRETLGAAFTVLPEKSPSGRTRFIDIVQPNADDSIIFELRPHYDGEYYAQKYSTDSHGFRSPETALQAQPGEVTVLGIGGSIMFGHGVADGKDFLSVAGTMLNQLRPERHWRVINTAVPTYNVVQKVETLKQKGLQFHPDLVVLEIASNNLDLPNYVRVQDDPLDFSHSFIVDYIREKLNMAAESERRNAGLATLHRSDMRWRSTVTPDPAKIPAAFRGLVGWEPFDKALDELKRLSVEHGFQVVVVANLEVDLLGQMLDEARKRGLPTVLAMPDLEDYIEKQYHEPFTLDRYEKSELVVNTENLHPSVLQHRMIAERLVREMLKMGMLDRLVGKVPPAAAVGAR